MARLTLLLIAAAIPSLSACSSCFGTCGDDDPDCLLAGLVLEQDGAALDLATVPAESISRHLPAATRATAVWAVGNDGAILRFDAAAWTSVTSGVTTRLRAVWGPDPAHLWAVGDGGVVLAWNGAAWGLVASGVTTDLNAVHGTGASDVWAVGVSGTTIHWDGAAWSSIATAIADPLTGVFAAAPGDVWAVGANGVVLRSNGTVWTRVSTPFPTSELISAVRGTAPNDVWAVGRGGWSMRFNREAWTPTVTPGVWLQSLGGSGPADVWAVADAGLSLFRFIGGAWVRVSTGEVTAVRAVWSLAPDDAFVVGASVAHWNGRAWATVEVPAHPQLNAVHGFGPQPSTTGGSVLAAWRTGAQDAINVIGTTARKDLEFGFADPSACTPSFCFAICTLKSHCSAASACTNAVRDGRATGTWRSTLGFTVEPADESTTFDLSVAVLSDPTCAENPAGLPPGEVLVGAGPQVPVLLEPEPEPVDDGGADCSAYTADCGTHGGIQYLGGYYPKTCACPAVMSDQGGSYLNELCGLPGAGRDCKRCDCP